MNDVELRLLAQAVLTDRQYRIWLLAENDVSQQTIADALHISRSTVKSTIKDARRKVIRAVRQHATTDADVPAHPETDPHRTRDTASRARSGSGRNTGRAAA